MILWRQKLQTMFTILLIVAFGFCFCKDNEPEPITEAKSPPDTSATNVQELMLDSRSKIEENINSIMALIKEKEKELQKTEQELSQKLEQLEQKEGQLASIENEIKHFRTITYLILVIGIILIIIGLILIFIKRKSKFNLKKHE